MKTLLVALLLIIAPTLTSATPIKAPTPAALKAQLETLKPGQFLWDPQVSPQGPVTVVVSLTEQRAYIYRNGIVIGVSTVSTGRKGRETPTGVFTVLQKSVEHKSTLYNSAPMPYMQRLTWDGVALHAGSLPGYPTSHGCVHLPLAFAKKLYEITGFSSTTVIISDAHSAPVEVYHPGVLAPMVANGKPQATPISAGEMFWNDPESGQGPLSVLISRADRRAYAYRNGQLVGTTALQSLDKPGQTGMAVFSLLQKPTPAQLTSSAPLHWSAVQLSNPEHGLTPTEQLGKISLAPEFVQHLRQAMDVGTTLVITDWPSTRETRSAANFTVISTDEHAPQQEPIKKQPAD
ncbi:L,D-transpeptidase [Pseudomonas cavernicola]|uniref:L,D-transpeptidase n=1 Tax=Pseudomonas cavernicola TaxID=2320866 RepID=A0A418XNY4_9PSED|nr:L,D-transpeptidase [Pseudomonas cavernicola]RJG14222.1 L,D-transpeptidase [Pseudomonas cavernicola]